MMPKITSTLAACMLMLSTALFPTLLYFMSTHMSLFLDWTILSVGSSMITMPIVVDWISLSFSVVVCTISGCVFCFSSSYMSHDPFLKRFIYLVLMFVLSMNFLIYIVSLPALLLGWDGLGIVSFALVVYYQNMKSLNAGMLTVLMNRVGDVMILLSIGLLVLQGHWMVPHMWDFSMSSWVCFMIMVAGMTKSAQIPFSSWLPAAMAAPTPVSALVHSSTLVTAGVYLLVRFNTFLSSFPFYSTMLLLMSVMTLMMAGLGANFENDLKKIIALSTLSQLGVMMLSLSMGAVFLALFHLYTHALFKALLFLCAGSIIHTSMNSQDLRFMGMSYLQLPYTTACLNVANLSLCGAPFLSGFYSKDLILETGLHSDMNLLLLVLIMLATGLTSAYSIRLSLSSLWGSSSATSFHGKSEDYYSLVSMTMLTTLAISSGVLFQSLILDFNTMYLLPVHMKVLPTVMVLLGVYWAGFLWDAHTMKPNLEMSFMSGMWFLAPLCSQPVVKLSMLLGTHVVRSVDEGWLEILGGQGLYMIFSSMSRTLQRTMVVVMHFMVVYVFVFMLLFFLSVLLLYD
uniref:NADH-ubiquinone oxidoreductase chain 5 n=1 Tax=Eualetes tulipa TaxID=765164 RepID=E2FLT4_9CAEN|nr:NADH dehydrogenase subunit 5 [Eualetes tulipa]ADI79400.1 NADH dehydrogenase subunit 5 [Eualetes tulipa]